MIVSCVNCGAEVAPEDRFCGNCGLALTPSNRRESAEGEPAPAVAPDAGETTSPSSTLSAAPDEPPTQAHGTADLLDVDADEPTDEGHHEEDEEGEEDYSEQFQPTLIDAAGPQAAAPAPAREPVHDTSPPEAPASGQVREPISGLITGEPTAPPAPAPSSGLESHTGPQDEMPRQGARAGGRGTGDVPPMAYSRTGGGHRSSRQLEPGTVLHARYEITKRIGGGGMGAVYYARDRNLGDAPRAVKEMIQSHLDESQQEKAIADFKRESMLLASLEHASIPTIYDYFFEDNSGRFYLVMKYISGGDCLARLRNAPGGRIDELTVTDWGMQVADVLDYLHNRRPPIIYRDLKPANLMIDGNTGRVMLIDFGIARWVSPQEKGVTAVGTMGYAPPELFSGKVEPRSDIYSLGATMFHLMTGSDPQDQPLLVFDFTKNPTPRQINPSLSNEMERILMRAVEYEPEKRFRSAAEMRETLVQHRDRLRAGAVSYGAVPAHGTPGGNHPTTGDVKTTAVEMVYCGFCGKTISADDVFCAHCGARQPIAAASASLRAARATARLVVMGTTEITDATFTLSKESNLVGRTDPQSNIFPDIDLSRFDPETKISRRHARIWRHGDTFLLEDLGSVNGTVVNDAVRLGPRQPRPLENGDRLRLGETTLHFVVG
ncbi:MAG TPA: protein kinase [Pyrinomonadaceae bacterium]|nr:protein kinase [Pyrinomonadaceae bacterium]